MPALRDALAAGAERFGFRLVEYSIQSNHLHLIVEADCRRSLSRGMKGLLVRAAKALNRSWERRGSVFVDRYHAEVQSCPRQVRNTLVYVLQNVKKHDASFVGVDPCSSAPWFRGWSDRLPFEPSPLPRSRTWLMKFGWLQHGPIGTQESPTRQPRSRPAKGSRASAQGRVIGRSR